MPKLNYFKDHYQSGILKPEKRGAHKPSEISHLQLIFIYF